jgi:hypothetical protein
MVQLEVPEMPRSLEETMAHDDAERQMRFHTETPATRSGNRPAIYHGHGAGADDAETRRWIRAAMAACCGTRARAVRRKWLRQCTSGVEVSRYNASL